MRVRELVCKYHSFTGDDWDGIEDFIDSLNKKQARKMFYSIYKANDREAQRVWKQTKRFMQDGR